MFKTCSRLMMAKLNFIETTRLRLYPWVFGDKDEFAAFHAGPTVGLRRQSAGAGDGRNTLLEHWLKEVETLPSGLGGWVIRDDTGRMLGEVLLKPWAREPEYVELQCRIREDADGHGYIGEAVRAILRYGTDLVGLTQILVLVGSNDRPSLQLVAELGFDLESS